MDAKAQDPSGKNNACQKNPYGDLSQNGGHKKPRNYLRTWGLNRDEDDEYEHPHTPHTTHEGDTQTTNDTDKQQAHEAIQRARAQTQNTNTKERTCKGYTRMLHGG